MGCDVVPEINETTNETIPGSATGNATYQIYNRP